ncbi:MAG: 16S rRNA (uracil(1498)-N(3))-methyltransferase [Clostridiales bacterium]|nr:16S rRNA (uracil(1498)-N(3))-methyltransferase [Clostridiales bacterium]
MPKFFAQEGQIGPGYINIIGPDANHLINVLRAKPGDEIIICDGVGSDYFCEIDLIDKKGARAKIIEKKPSLSEPSLRVTLFQALTKSDKFEFIIQKCVEIGVYEIIPIVTKNTIVKPDLSGKKLERYNKIAESAAKQSGRGIIPKVARYLDFSEAAASVNNYDRAFVCYEKEGPGGLKGHISGGYRSACAFIGPEGGFTPEEIKKLQVGKVEIVSLGARVLRSETAGMVFTSILLYETGDI